MYIGRRGDRSIYGLWTVRQSKDQEELPDDDPEVLEFLAPKPPIDYSDSNNQDKAIKALALCVADIGQLTVPEIHALFKQKWDSLN